MGTFFPLGLHSGALITSFKRSVSVFFDDERGQYRARFRRSHLSDAKEKVPDTAWRSYGLAVPVRPSDRHEIAALKWAVLRAKELDEQDVLTQDMISGATPEKMTLAAVFDLYQFENPRLVSAETKERDRVGFDAIRRHVDVDEVRPEDVDDPFAVRYRNARMEDTVLARRGEKVTDIGRPVRSRTIRNELDLLRRLCAFALKWSRRTSCAALQFTELPELEEQDSLQEPLTLDQVAAVLELAGDRDRRIFIYGICTMLRKTPLLGHRGEWVDWTRAWLKVPADVMKKGRAKRRRGLSIPLCDAAIDQLNAQHLGYTWPNSATGEPLTWLDDTLHRLVERASKKGPTVPRFSLHDLRSTGATWLRNAGVDPLIIKHLMGHSLKTGDVTDSYTKIFEQSMREAVSVFDEKFVSVAGSRAAIVHISTKRSADSVQRHH